ncbi:polysaccharide deacetylase family protein [Allomuricauda sp. R78024]|uniref:polysaccharide deacetylase family protein n=1 Tax=Allomuricauda sp. R78024 TaxID=3093867 RepID=UPI0037C750D1
MRKHKVHFLITVILCFLMHTIKVFGQPKISLSFDDGMIIDRPGYVLTEWNELLLNKLKENHVQSILFVAGYNKLDERGKYVIQSWNDNGHLIANHTMNHPNYNSEKWTSERFMGEFLSNDSLISRYSNYTKLFRFPYLKEGNNPEKIKSFRTFMKDMGYRNGHVTIDASDWYIDQRLVARLKKEPKADLTDFRDFYLEHIWDRAQFYEKLSYELNNRHIKHTLLLHHNLAAALFINDLIQMFKDKGWVIVSAKEAYADPIYAETPDYAGESLIYALAKDSGKYKDVLRYPAEDSRYEKERMKVLGLE